VASARCGGWCGHCWPVGKTLFLSHPQCDSSNKNRVIKGCPIAGYVGFDGICYKSFTEQKTRDEARQACAADGGVLAMPKDIATNTFLANLAGVVWGRWFGLTDVNNDGQWVFEDGQNLTSSGYSNWLPGEPRPDYGKGGCVGFWEDGSFWDEKDCSKLRGFICQLQLQEKPLATRFCRITSDSTAVWDKPVVLTCDIDLQNLSQVLIYTKLSQVRVYTKLSQVRIYTKLSQVRIYIKLSQVGIYTKLSQVSVYTKLPQVFGPDCPRCLRQTVPGKCLHQTAPGVWTRVSQVFTPNCPTKLSQVIVYIALSQIVVNNVTALSVATELQVITTQVETLSSGDVSTITTILQKIVNASATEQIGESILTIADNFMKVNETVLLDSHQTNRAPTRVLQALEMFTDRVDLSTDRFTSKRQDVALQAADVSVQEFDQGQGLALFLNENSSNSLSEGRLSSFTKEDEREGFLQTSDIDVSISLPANLSNVLPLDNTTDTFTVGVPENLHFLFRRSEPFSVPLGSLPVLINTPGVVWCSCTSLDYHTGRPGFDSGSYPNKSEHAPRRCTLGKEVRVSYILYNDDSLFVQPSQDAVRTRIISGRIAGMQVKNLPEPVVITFAPTKYHYTKTKISGRFRACTRPVKLGVSGCVRVCAGNISHGVCRAVFKTRTLWDTGKTNWDKTTLQAEVDWEDCEQVRVTYPDVCGDLRVACADVCRPVHLSGSYPGRVQACTRQVYGSRTPGNEVSDKEGKVVRCVFWDFEAEAGQGAWSSDGCMSQGKANGRYTCTCNHLTNFAVLFQQ
ncbi:hypothetical protein Bbelb_284250, partial [Branchiostoma belcheri]